jgi:predicted phosphodiesterase
MGRRALISDIHSNLAALEAVLKDIGSQQVDAIYCLGDVVGYGPQPVESMIQTIAVCQSGKCILGNHDHAVLHEPIGFNRSAREAVLWTQMMLRPRLWTFGGRRHRWHWLRSLPTTFTEGDVLYVHASPRQNLEEYILEDNTVGVSLTGEDPQRLLEENFALVAHTCFIGHTHRPGVITGDDFQWHSIPDLEYRWPIDERKTIINIGSVGQPRDGDPRACYVLFDDESVVWRRVEYDIERTRRLIHENSHLENRLGDRLLEGR